MTKTNISYVILNLFKNPPNREDQTGSFLIEVGSKEHFLQHYTQPVWIQ